MDQRSHILRSAVPLIAVILSSLVATGGCRSDAQSDLVARELRLQEDKIYAQQDYLEQYQRLICQYRAENVALKQKLAEQSTDQTPTNTATSSGEPASTGSSAAPLEAPTIPPAPPGRSNEPTDLQIPPLDMTPRQPPRPVDESAGGGDPSPATTQLPEFHTQLASQIVPLAQQRAIAGEPHDPHSRADTTPPAPVDRTELKVPADSSPADEPSGEPEIAEHVWITGEVVANDAGGPRLIVDVTPLSDTGRPAPFAGELSLMVLAPSDVGPPRNLARWDFLPDEAAAAAGFDDASPRTMRFHLELPAETPLDRPDVLWVRLLDKEQKLLANAPLDFRTTAAFSSVPFATAPDESPKTPIVVRVVNGTLDSEHSPHNVSPSAAEGWTIAQPSQPGQAAPRPADPEGAWRASTQPMPMAIAQTPPGRPVTDFDLLSKPHDKVPVSNDGPRADFAKSAAKPMPALATAWSPERPVRTPAAAISPRRPVDGSTLPSLSAWSPTR